MRCGHRVNLLRLTWSSFEESRDDRPLPGYDTPPHVTSSYTTSLDATPQARYWPVRRLDDCSNRTTTSPYVCHPCSWM
ncbi:hypothetical protein BI295_24980 [Mycobacterium avium subsp. hominissuis]|nr:hypothetical protein BI295_24980 [Mycobacterium avium subsp. hominissuis]